MQSKAKTVRDYLAELPEDRRIALTEICKVVRQNLSLEIEEGMGYGMISWHIPHSVFPAGYHCDPKMPLGYAGLASQKQYISLYMLGFCTGCLPGKETPEMAWFRKAWAAAGKGKLDMGRCCIRVKRLEDLPLDVIGEAIRRVPATVFIQRYEALLAQEQKRKAANKAAAKAPAKRRAGQKKAPVR